MKIQKIYVDIGNTNIKINVNKKIFVFCNQKILLDEQNFFIIRFWSKLKINQKLTYNFYVASVQPQILAIFIKKFRVNFCLHLLNYFNQNLISFPNIKLKQDQKNIGSDLIATAIAVNQLIQKKRWLNQKILTVCLGTLVVYLLQKNNKVLGIAFDLGIENSLQALVKSAFMLNQINFKYSYLKLIANENNTAVSSGILYSKIFAILGFASNLKIKNHHVVISGGDYPVVKKLLKKHLLKHFGYDYIVISGLKIWAKSKK